MGFQPKSLPYLPTLIAFLAAVIGLGSLLLLFDIKRPAFGRSLAAQSQIHRNYLPIAYQTRPFTTPIGFEVGLKAENSGFDQFAGLKSAWLRLNGVLWSDVEPVQGQRDWSVLTDLEHCILEAAQLNAEVILVVRKTPLWAQKDEGYYCGPVHEDKLDEFGDFLHALVGRYSAPPYNVKYWEIGNEPDVDPGLSDFWGPDVPFGCWGDESDEYYGGGYFAEMLKAVYPRIKAADPQSKVLIGGLLMNCDPRSYCTPDDKPVEYQPTQFLKGILHNGGGGYFDVVAFHAYDFYYGDPGQYGYFKWESQWDKNGPLLVAKAGYIKEVLASYQVFDKGLMSTEMALICGDYDDPPGLAGCESDWDSPYESTKASYVAQTYAAAIAEGVDAGIWYRVDGWRNSGLLYEDLSARPAFLAMQFAYDVFSGSDFDGKITSTDVDGLGNVFGYKFSRGERRIWIIWSLDEQPRQLSPPGEPLAMWNVLGEQIEIGNAGELNLSLEPVYIEWSP